MSSHPSVSPPLLSSLFTLFRIAHSFTECVCDLATFLPFYRNGLSYAEALLACAATKPKSVIRVTETKCDVFPHRLLQCGFRGGRFAFHPLSSPLSSLVHPLSRRERMTKGTFSAWRLGAPLAPSQSGCSRTLLTSPAVPIFRLRKFQPLRKGP